MIGIDAGVYLGDRISASDRGCVPFESPNPEPCPPLFPFSPNPSQLCTDVLEHTSSLGDRVEISGGGVDRLRPAERRASIPARKNLQGLLDGRRRPAEHPSQFPTADRLRAVLQGFVRQGGNRPEFPKCGPQSVNCAAPPRTTCRQGGPPVGDSQFILVGHDALVFLNQHDQRIVFLPQLSQLAGDASVVLPTSSDR